MTFCRETLQWEDSEAYALDVRDRFVACANSDPELCAHRDFIEKHVYGFGERAFHWLWKLIVDTMPDEFRFLEVGVYKGQVLSLVRLLADRTGRTAQIYGVTPLSRFAGVTGKFPDFPDEDYMEHITVLHGQFDLGLPHIIVGDSTEAATQKAAGMYAPFDIVYVDGCHEESYVVKDLLFYPTLLKPGGLLVIDDASCYLKQPFGFFQGIDDVCQAVRTVIEPDPRWEHLLAVVHNRVWRKAQ